MQAADAQPFVCVVEVEACPGDVGALGGLLRGVSHSQRTQTLEHQHSQVSFQRIIAVLSQADKSQGLACQFFHHPCPPTCSNLSTNHHVWIRCHTVAHDQHICQATRPCDISLTALSLHGRRIDVLSFVRHRALVWQCVAQQDACFFHRC